VAVMSKQLVLDGSMTRV